MNSLFNKEKRQSRFKRIRELATFDDYSIVPELYDVTPQSPDQIEITICIINPRYFRNVYTALQSISCNNQQDINYEVIIAKGLHKVPTTKISESFRGVRFAKTGRLSDLIRLAKSNWLLVMDETCQTESGFLQHMFQSISRNDVGIVEPRIRCIDEAHEYPRLWEAGSIIQPSGEILPCGHLENAEKQEYGYRKGVDCILPYCYMLDISVLRELGGFSDELGDCYGFADLSMKMRSSGYKTVYDPLANIVSCGTPEQIMAKLQKGASPKRRALFAAKWSELLESKETLSDEETCLCNSKEDTKKTVLVIDDKLPMFDTNAGDRMLIQMMELLVALDMNVYYLGADHVFEKAYADPLKAKGIELVGYNGGGDEDVKAFLKEHGSDIKYVVIGRPGNVKRYLAMITTYSSARIIYNLVDLHYLRLQRELELEARESKVAEPKAPMPKNPEPTVTKPETVRAGLTEPKTLSRNEEMLQRTKSEELAIIKSAYCSITPSAYEAELLSKEPDAGRIVTVPIFIYDRFPELDTNFHARKDLLFVGGFLHKPNLDAMLWFCTQVLPQITEKLPDVQLRIAGSDMPQAVLDLQGRNVIIEGRLSDDELDALYERCRLVVVPLRYGAGVKGKLVEAMQKGLPVVSTGIGTEGLPEIADYIRSTDSAEEFAQKVVELYDDPQLLAVMARDNQHYVAEHFSVQRAERIYAEIFEL
jgi:glycosyltransferase involved in cell wall biosynthesis